MAVQLYTSLADLQLRALQVLTAVRFFEVQFIGYQQIQLDLASTVLRTTGTIPLLGTPVPYRCRTTGTSTGTLVGSFQEVFLLRQMCGRSTAVPVLVAGLDLQILVGLDPGTVESSGYRYAVPVQQRVTILLQLQIDACAYYPAVQHTAVPVLAVNRQLYRSTADLGMNEVILVPITITVRYYGI